MAADESGRLFEQFKTMLAPYAARMYVDGDGNAMYGVDMAPEASAIHPPGSPGRGSGSALRSYYLMPICLQSSLTKTGYEATGRDPRWGAKQRELRSAALP